MSEPPPPPTAASDVLLEDPVDSSKLLEFLETLSSTITVHLIKCRIDILTIKTGFAIGCDVSIGSHLESRLIDSLKTFTPMTSEEYIYHELCTTKDDRAIVNLCGCLGIGYNEDSASEVLAVLATRHEKPLEERVLKTQWILLLQLCAKVFDGDALEETIQNNLRIGLDKPPTIPLSITTRDASESLSRFLLNVGRVLGGDLVAVHVTGIDQCGWVTAWAQDVLGLRLELYDEYGNLRCPGINLRTEKAQVTVRFVKVQNLSTSLLTVVTEG